MTQTKSPQEIDREAARAFASTLWKEYDPANPFYWEDVEVFEAGARHGRAAERARILEMLRKEYESKPFLMGYRPFAHPLDLADWIEKELGSEG